MDLFTYLLARKDKNSLLHKGDLFSYLLGKKAKGEVKTEVGTIINITDVTREKISSLTLYKESTQDGTPTSENPVEIKTVKGYRNLFDKNNSTIFNTYIGQSSHKISTNTGGNNRTIVIPCKANTKYFIKKFVGAKVLITGTTATAPELGMEIDQFNLTENLFSYTFTTNNTANYLVVQVCTSSDTNLDYTVQQILDNFQITEGDLELPYVPYGTNWLAITNTNGTDTNYYTIPLRENEIVGKLTNLDKLLIDIDGHCWLNKVFAKIDSYDGETITTDYISTTGGLDEGATIYYVDTPQLIDLDYVSDIRLYIGANNITNSDEMTMELEYY